MQAAWQPACTGASGDDEVLTSCCGGGSHRRRCSSSGRSGCSAGTNAGTGSGAGRQGPPATSPSQTLPGLPCASGTSRTPTSGPPLRLSLTPRREISRSQEAGGRRWTVSFRAVAIWGRGRRGGALRGSRAPPLAPARALGTHSGSLAQVRTSQPPLGTRAASPAFPQPGPQPPCPLPPRCLASRELEAGAQVRGCPAPSHPITGPAGEQVLPPPHQ